MWIATSAPCATQRARWDEHLPQPTSSTMFQFQSVIPFSYTFQLPVAAWGAAGAISQPKLSPTFVAGGYTFQLMVSAANTSNFQESVCAALELQKGLIAPVFIKVCYNLSLCGWPSAWPVPWEQDVRCCQSDATHG